ncbi:MAG TPA: fused MFS/spermidine synthase [Myxococcales bacterium]|jgi:spermidine synthase
MPKIERRVALLLFASGACGLLYQIAWFRLFRDVFGSSTPASAAVLAIYIGGLGLGGLLLGRRADRAASPLAMYARLEAGVGVSAALTPFLVGGVRWLYLELGGSLTLGTLGGMAVRVLLSALVLGVPTVLMGGTMPAAVRAVETAGDVGRRGMALLYGANALGGVVGAMGANFFALEIFGTRTTLWLGALCNLLVFVSARSLARGLPQRQAAPEASPVREAAAPRAFVLAAAGVVGFAFFLLETVWYRMLGPLLGGSVYTFGLIVAVALLGIGLGGWLYSRRALDRPASLTAFAATCSAEAALAIVPFALGDRLVILAASLHGMSAAGFPALVLAWTFVALLVVLPASVVAGYQFPLLVGLLGSGDERVGRDVGSAYAFNTAGSILGSLAGGFGLLPLLTAPGCWRLVAVLLALLAALATGLALRRRERGWAGAAAMGALALALAAAPGPSAVWRQSAVGAGRVGMAQISGRGFEAWSRHQQAIEIWEREGVEASVALVSDGAYAFLVNGRIDGNALHDAGTQVMSGLVGALLAPKPRSAMVIGLGTGSTAGWLGAVPSLERVDVVEIEPLIRDVARACAPVNQRVLDNPKVHLAIGDAREVLAVSPRRYDLVFSEPSNPYRAGIASLYTREFYGTVERMLEADGVFVQWVQSYEIDGATLRTVVRTLRGVFGHVELFFGCEGDLLLVATRAPLVIDAPALRARLEEEPYRSAIRDTWGVSGLEGLLSHHVATDAVAARLAAAPPEVFNTDDVNVVEFGLAATVGKAARNNIRDLLSLSRALGEHPLRVPGLDWEAVQDGLAATPRLPDVLLPPANADQKKRFDARQRFSEHRFREALQAWKAQPAPAVYPSDRLMLAVLETATGDAGARASIEALEGHPGERALLEASLHRRAGQLDQACASLEAGFRAYREDPWASRPVLSNGLGVARDLGAREPECAQRLFEAIRTPFAVEALEQELHDARLDLAKAAGFAQFCEPALGSWVERPDWNERVLGYRRDCLRATGSVRLAEAERDLARLRADEPMRVSDGLLPAAAAAAREP